MSVDAGGHPATEPSTTSVTDAFPADTLRRLRALKLRYDPGNLFRDNFNITRP